MKLRLVAAACALSFFSTGLARASTCEASYLVEGKKATRWFDLGEVAGAKRKENCVVKAKNHLANAKLDELGLPRKVCAHLPVSVSVFTRVDSKARPGDADAVVKTDLPEACAKTKASRGDSPE